MKTIPIGHWWVRCFMRMYNNLVPKIQRSHLVKRNLFIPFSNVFELWNLYYCILPPQTPSFKKWWWKQSPEDTDESVASWGCMIILYQTDKAVLKLRGINSYLFLIFSIFTTNIITYYLLNSRFKTKSWNRPQRTLMILLLHEDV